MSQAQANSWVSPVDQGSNGCRSVVTYQLDGLNLKALITWPCAEPGSGPWPVVLALHGFHPEPRRYGILSNGINQRPGAYYSGVPTGLAKRGFICVMPDYRGHNDSEGQAGPGFGPSNAQYARDAAAVLPLIPQIPGARADSVHLWGHSMGADIGLRVALNDAASAVSAGPSANTTSAAFTPSPAVTRTVVLRSASFWSTSGGPLREQFERYTQRSAATGRPLAAMPATARDPRDHLDALSIPLLLQHSAGDAQTPYRWSHSLHEACCRLGRVCTLRTVQGDHHYFEGADFEQALDRDVAWFRSATTHPSTKELCSHEGHAS